MITLVIGLGAWFLIFAIFAAGYKAGAESEKAKHNPETPTSKLTGRDQ